MAYENYKRVLSPITIRGLTVKNRIARTAHATFFADMDGHISDQYIAYHLARAEGGVGLEVLAPGFVHKSSNFVPRTILCWSNDIIPGYQKLMKVINPTGMRVIQQIWHGGGIYADWREVKKGPSALPGMYTGMPTRAFNHEEIRELVDAYTLAAVRCEKGGLHGCEIAGSHGYLVMQFLSPWSNRRTDKYGGSLENRARFLREILTGIRGSVSDTFIVGLRLGPEALEGGLIIDEIVDVLKMLKADGLVDYINMSMGGYHNPETMVPAVHTPTGVELNWNSGVREKTGLVTFISGRFRTLEEAEQVISQGEADMVGMTRATIADPYLVKKTVEQGAESVRTCIGCNQLCVGNIFSGQPLQCTVNVQAGRESEFPQTAIPKTSKPKKVLVVGGGPAGMEAARVAALAGHQVHLYEATPDLGGALKLVKNIPYLGGFYDVCHWLQEQIYSLGVSVHTSTYIETDDILAANPDVVLLATGSRPRDNLWQLGAPAVVLENLKPPLLVNVPDLLEKRVVIDSGKTVVIVDDRGHYEAVGVAEYLLQNKVSVEYVTRFGDLAPQMAVAWRSRPALRRLNASGQFTLHTHSYLADVSAQGVIKIDSFVGQAAKLIKADHVVSVGYNLPNDELFGELQKSAFKGRVELIGDCSSHRYLHSSIHDGFNIACSI